MAFNQSPEAAIHARPDAKDTIAGSISDAMGSFGVEFQKGVNWAAFRNPTMEFSDPKAGVHEQGFDFAQADAAKAGGLYASVLNKPDAAKQAGIDSADDTLNQFIQGKDVRFLQNAA